MKEVVKPTKLARCASYNRREYKCHLYGTEAATEEAESVVMNYQRNISDNFFSVRSERFETNETQKNM